MTEKERMELKMDGFFSVRDSDKLSVRFSSGGGSFTADQMITLGQIAREFGSGKVVISSRLSAEIIGIEGHMVPEYEPGQCRSCKVCQVKKHCPANAISFPNKKVHVNPDLCQTCGICRKQCLFHIFREDIETKYQIYLGGTWGRKSRMADRLPVLIRREEIFPLLDHTLEWYRANGEGHERFGYTLERLGFDRYLRDLNCCSVSCFADLQKRRGAFAQYPEDVNIRLVGVISCAGCPTRAYPEKILKRVDSVMQFRTEYLHISNCMMAFCPFVNKYIEIIQKHYPDVKIVKGTHTEHVTQEAFRQSMVTAFEHGKGMPDIILGKENE